MHERSNQTQFTFEEPLFEAPPEVPTEPTAPQPPWYKRPRNLILGGGAVFLLLIVSLTMLSRPVVQQQLTDLTASPTPTPAARGPYDQRLQELQTELQAADPTRQDLPFPPVNMELQLASPRP